MQNFTGLWLKRIGLIVMLALAGAGCVSWKPQWQKPRNAVGGIPPKVAMQAAYKAMHQADSEAGLLESIAAFKLLLDAEPENYQALIQLSNQQILLGAAYTGARHKKSKSYQLARLYAEQAMYTNPEFRRRVNAGEPPWQACEALGVEYMEAMLFWVTAVFYNFKEGWSLPVKIMNMKWMRYCNAILERMEAIDPNWGGGAVHLSRGIYYFIEAQGRGGNLEKSVTAVNRAVEVGPNRMLNRWGRAKYFWLHRKLRNRELFVADLEWILRQDMDAAQDVFPWKAFIKRDARLMLDRVDTYF